MRRRLLSLSALAALLAAVAATPAHAAVGDLTQLPGTLGCFQQLNEEYQTISPRCQRARFPGGPVAVQVSADGRSVYALTAGSWSGGGGLAIYDRNPSGVLTQKRGLAGCISTTGTPNGDGVNTCLVGRNVDTYRSLAVSPDGRSVYVAGDGLAVIDRDPVSGELAQQEGTAGCVTQDGSGGTCGVAPALGGENEVTVSPDARNVYVAAGDGVAIFDRDTTGALVQTGCISASGSPDAEGVNTCVDGKALAGASSVSVSPDGRNVYVTAGSGSGAVTVFDRDAHTGALAQKAGTTGCVSQTGGPLEDPCADGKALNGASSVTVSPDGRSVYVASGGSLAVAIFDRDPQSGALTQKPGRDGCISESSSPGGTPTVYYCMNSGRVLDGVHFVRVSPDGQTVYAAYGSSDPGAAVAWFDRDRATGALSAGGRVSDGGSGGKCAVGAWSGGFSGKIAVSPDNRTVYGTGNDIGPYGFLFVLGREQDLVAPQTTISSGPAAQSATIDRTPTFAFASSEAGSTFACSVDGGQLAPCSSPFTTPTLGIGQHTFVVQSTDSAGNVDTSPAARGFSVIDPPPAAAAARAPAAGAPSASATTDRRPPRVLSFGLTNNRFVVRASSGSASRDAPSQHKRGTTLSYTLSEAASVRIVIARLTSGRRSGGRCVVASIRLRRAQPCARTVRAGMLTQAGRRGTNRIAFTGWMRSTALAPGRYQATLTATDSADNVSQPQTVTFRIVTR